MLVTVSFSLENVLQEQCRRPKMQAREKRCEERLNHDSYCNNGGPLSIQ